MAKFLYTVRRTVKNSNHYISKTVEDILKIPTDLSYGRQKLCSVKKLATSFHKIAVHCKKNKKKNIQYLRK